MLATNIFHYTSTCSTNLDCSSNKCIHTWENPITMYYSLVSTCCSSLGDVGCSGFPVCQPCLSQHHYQRGISSACFWIWGLPLVSLQFCQKHYICFYMSIFIWQSYNKVWSFNLDTKDDNKLSVFCLIFSTQSWWPWCWQHSLNTFCTLSIWTVRIPGKIRLSTCSTLSSSQVLYILYMKQIKSALYMHLHVSFID